MKCNTDNNVCIGLLWQVIEPDMSADMLPSPKQHSSIQGIIDPLTDHLFLQWVTGGLIWLLIRLRLGMARDVGSLHTVPFGTGLEKHLGHRLDWYARSSSSPDIRKFCCESACAWRCLCHCGPRLLTQDRLWVCFFR